MEFILPMITFCFVTSFSPGPNNMMLMASGVNYGIAKSLPHFLGINIGFPLMLAAIAFGLGEILIRSPNIYLAIKILGIGYLLFLAMKIALSSQPVNNSNNRKPLTFMQAVLFQWINPKAWVIAIGAIASFTHSVNFVEQVTILIMTYAIVGGGSMFAWLYIGEKLKRLLSNNKRLTYFNYTMAVLLVISVLPMVVVEI